MAYLENTHRCLSLDLLGFGQSSQPDITYDIATEVRFVLAFVEALGLEQVHLVGHSFGGWVAAAVAIAAPERVKTLALLAPGGIRDDRFAGRYRWLMPLLWETVWVDRLLDWGSPMARRLGWGQQWQFLAWVRGQLLAQPVARQFLQRRRRPEDAVDTVEGSLVTISAPTLVLAAEQDDTIPLWHCQTYAAGIPQAQLVLIPDAPHQLPSQPEAIGAPLSHFWRHWEDREPDIQLGPMELGPAG
ncbi:MAG: alpha/beta hydrolase [Synechococcales cyanobacterium]